MEKRTEKRTVQEITQDMKETILRLLDATKRAEQAERDRKIAIVELLSLQKELKTNCHRLDVLNDP